MYHFLGWLLCGFPPSVNIECVVLVVLRPDVRESRYSACFTDASVGGLLIKNLELYFLLAQYAWASVCSLLLVGRFFEILSQNTLILLSKRVVAWFCSSLLSSGSYSPLYFLLLNCLLCWGSLLSGGGSSSLLHNSSFATVKSHPFPNHWITSLSSTLWLGVSKWQFLARASWYTAAHFWAPKSENV